MTTSKVGVAIDALISTFQAALGTSVTVLDGAIPGSGFPSSWLVVGGDGGVAEDETSATSKQTWAGLGAKTRDEQITVTCAAGAWSGGGTAKTIRDAALAVLAAAEQALRNDPSLGNITQGGCEMSDASLHHLADDSGIGAALVFTIMVPFRLEK